MKIKASQLVIATILILFGAASARAQNTTVNGNLTVTGTTYLQGDTTTFGTWTSGSSAGLLLNYSNSGTGTINFVGSGSTAVWQWWQFNGSADLPSMVLDQNNELLLYSGTVPGAILSPSGTSSFSNNVTFSGSYNEMPNQTRADSASVLTQGLGDGRYVQTSSYVMGTGSSSGFGVGSTLALEGGSASGANTFAVMGNANGAEDIAAGSGANVNGTQALAIGYQATGTGGNFSTAIGAGANAANGAVVVGPFAYGGYGDTALGMSAIASGAYAIAIGHYPVANYGICIAMGNGASATDNSNAIGLATNASGYFSNAYGWNAITSGYMSNAVGNTAVASGNYSNAFGNYVTAQAYGETAVGQYNILEGSVGSWVATDDLFVVGNGSGTSNPSNAFVVHKNGDTTVSGALVVSGSTGNTNRIRGSTTVYGSTQFDSGLAVTGTSVPLVVGTGTVNTVVATGTNTLVLIPQQGDVLMGPYVAGQQPPTTP